MSTWNKHYHWKTKGCTPWARAWLAEQLEGRSMPLRAGDSSPDAPSVHVDKLTSFDGDVELGNRKGKLITIYDCVVTLSWSGKADDGSEVSGTITFPEVSHEVEDNQESYRFETEMSTPSSGATLAAYDVVRKQLAPSLEDVFKRFRPQLIETHAKDLGHEGEAQTKEAPAAGAAAPAGSAAPAKPCLLYTSPSPRDRG